MSFSVSEIKKVLRGYELPEESLTAAANEICSKHTADLSAIGEEKAEAEKRAKAAEKKVAELETAEKELAELKKADYKSQLDAVTAERDKLKSDFEAYKTEQAGKETRGKQETAFREVMKDNNIPEKHFDKIIRYSGDIISKIEFDDKGKPTSASLKAAKDYIKADWDDHVETISAKGTDTPTPPANNGGKTVRTKDEIMQIKDAGERQAAIKEAIQNGSTEFKL